jgi:hypothetical protein
MTNAILSIPELINLFGFTPEELALNRSGRLSVRQRQQLFYQSLGHLIRGIAVIVLDLVLMASLAGEADLRWERWMLTGTGLALLATGLLLASASAQVLMPRVRHVSGVVQRSGDADRPRILAKDVELRLSFRRWKRLPPALPGTYRVFYGPGPNLLSLEPEGQTA